MPTTRLSSKGQIVIPRTIRQSNHWEPGQLFSVEETTDGLLLKPQAVFPPTTFADLEQAPLLYDGPKIPVEQHDGAYALLLDRQQDPERD